MKYGHFTLLPEQAFIKVGGQIKPQGGGSGGSSAPTNQTVTQTSIPEYARPYAESMLGQTNALTDINKNPYQPYQGQQVAGFSPMQVQGMTGIANQQVAPQITDASNFAFQSGAGGLGAYQNAASLQNAALDYGAAGAQGAFANADLINAYGGEAYKSGQMGQQLGIAGGAKFGNMGAAAGQLGQDIGTAGGAYYGGQGMNYGAQGANLAGANLGVGMTGMQAGLGYGQGAQNPYAVQGYMNPYLQASLQPQLAEMQRQYGISGAQGQSNATKAGAFGGSREALMFAENQRNKNIAMNQAIGQGYNTAYDVANRNMQAAASLGMQGAGVGLAGLQGANQNYLTGLQGAQTGLQGVNTQLAGTAQGMQGAQVGLAGVDRQLAGTAQGMQGANIGMQGASQAGQLMLGGAGMGLQGVQGAVGAGQYGLAGLGLAGSAGSTLGALGQTQFGQQQAINQAQLQAGAQQQALQQQGLNVAYQQYQDQMNYPYKQLAFQSDMMRGLPLSQASQTVYQNTGNIVPQIAGAGLAAYGASAGRAAKEGGLMSYARGGTVQSYAMGGQPVVDPRAVAATSPAALSSKLAQLSDGQLQAYARTVKDAVALAEVKAEMARRAGVRQPQGEEPTQTVAESVAGQGGIAEQPVMAAGGGIVALARGSEEPVRDRPGDIHTDNPDAPTQTPNWTRLFPEGSLIRNLRVPVGSDVRNALNSQRQSADSAVQSGTISPEALAIANEAQQRQEMDSQVQTGMVPRAQFVDMNQAQQRQEMDSQVQPSEFSSSDLDRMTEEQQMQDADSQVQPRGGITAIPPVAGATPATGAPVGGGIIPTSAVPPAGGGITDVGTPAGGAPRTGTTAPVNAITPRTAGAGGHGATVGSTGAGIPVGVPGDPMNFATYRANVEDMAKLDPEDKATLANMQARAEKRLRRAEGQEKNVMNDAFIAGGLAMMGGLNLADGIRRAAEQGGKQYFSSQAEARKAIDKAEEAQDAFYQYRTALKQGNKKLANEMYGTFHKSYADYISRITSAGITAGASLENAKATREATEAYRKDQIEQRGFDRDEKIRQFDLSLKQNENQFITRMKELGNQQAITSFEQLDRTFKDTMAAKDAAQAKVFAEYKPKFERFTLMDPAKMSDADKKQYNALNTEYKAALLSRLTPWDDQLEQVQNRKAAMMGIRPIGSKSGTSSPFKVVGVE
jgi:hypothetical protein